jgi:alkanesulfonate monooxygenase SsuD/methylene tetrahydromethanopterin reductase-like flavin-dependent oxidoreductase (luciferase family)
VLVDLHVVLAAEAAAARRLARDHVVIGEMSASRPSIEYVGTPTGLAGLITDMHTLGICDGATLLVPPLDSILAAIADSVLPLLRARGVVDLASDALSTLSTLRTRSLVSATDQGVCLR